MLAASLLCAALAQAPAAAELATAGAGTPRLHIDADRSPLLLFKMNLKGPFLTEPLCTAPCDAVIDGRGAEEFFFGAPGVAPSGNFQLQALAGDLTAHVRTGNQRLTLFGFVATGVGFLSLSAGTAGLLGKGAPLGLSITGIIFGLMSGALGTLVMYEGRTTYAFEPARS